MNIDFAHHTVIGRMTLILFLVVGMATADVWGCLVVFAVLCISLVILGPLMLLLHRICVSRKVSALRRRIVVMVPPTVLALWVLSLTNGFGGIQRTLLSDALTSVPKDTQIVEWQGSSVIITNHCTFLIRCDPDSLRKILHSSSFEVATGPQVPLPVPFATAGERLQFKRRHGGPYCFVSTDASYSWAQIVYAF